MFQLVVLASILIVCISLLILYIISKLFFQLKQKDAQALRLIIETQEKERAHLARELHDNLGPLLSLTQMQISFLIEQNDSSKIKNILPQIQQQVIDSIHLCRELSHSLSPELGINNDFYSSLSNFIDKIKGASHININFDYQLENTLLNEEMSNSILRICQELITNTLKHSQAKNIFIKMLQQNNQLILTYNDNGSGYDFKKSSKGIGLKNIITRIDLMQGVIQHQSFQNSSIVTIKIPKKLK